MLLGLVGYNPPREESFLSLLRPDTVLPPDTFVITKEAFDAVPRLRAQYILAYALAFVLWLVSQIAVLRGYEFPLGAGIGVLVVIVACQVVFYFGFVKVLRVMGYPTYMIVGACVFVFIPVPGIFIIALFDQRIAKAWAQADLLYADQHAKR